MKVEIKFKDKRSSRIHEIEGLTSITCCAFTGKLIQICDKSIGLDFVYPIVDIEEMYICPEQRQSSEHATEH